VIVLSIIIAFLDFLPFLGTGTAFVPWCVYTFLVGDYKRLIFLVVLYATTQIVRQLIQPKLVGDEVGLNPLPTLVFIYIGYRLGGVLWMIIAVPIGMIIINMVKAGAFDYIINDVKILVRGIKSLR
jgi:predicted PurR-regulated permease PerM